MRYGLHYQRKTQSLDAWIRKDRGLNEETHQHAKASFCFLLSGNVLELDDRGRTRRSSPLTLNLQPAGWSHAHQAMGDYVAMCFALNTPFVESLGDDAAALLQPRLVGAGRPVEIAAQMLRDLRVGDAASDLLLQEHARNLVSSLNPANRKQRPASNGPWIAKAREILHDRFRENPTIQEIAYEIGFNQDYFIRSFEAQVGRTPGAYLRMIRMQHAAKMVSTSELSMKEIAAEAGFADQAHFSREFRRLWGVSPQRYRALIR